ncbi:MAG: hypothetical protein MUC87_06530 [Bacteroidia bacterium]|nr:hypothetical protein [Bacteroidia bacterium]
MQNIDIKVNECQSTLTSVFTKNEDNFSHHWNIKIEAGPHSFYLEFLQLENSQSIFDLSNKSFRISDTDLLQLQSCFINDSGIKIANQIQISFDEFDSEIRKIHSKVKLNFNSYIVSVETDMLFAGYNFYEVPEINIERIIIEKKLGEIRVQDIGINNRLYNY